MIYAKLFRGFLKYPKSNFVIFVLLLFNSTLLSQTYMPADPYNQLFFERNAIENNSNITSLALRPTFFNNSNDFSVKYRSEIFINSGAPNLENMSDRWVGKGVGIFSSINFSFRNTFLLGSIEPYYFIDQNAKYDEPLRIPLLSQLNDNQSHHKKSPYQTLGIREFQLYLHWKGVGGGISNANMWWGPGIHTSLIMSNNTSGFPHIVLGTLEEKRINNWGFIGRYIFSKFDDRNIYEPYYTSVILGVTYYSNPIVSIGFTRSAMTGGTHERADEISWGQAALAFLKGVTFGGDYDAYVENWSYDDHTASGYVSTFFPNSKLTLFIDVGRNDIAWDIYNMILAPDHSIATIFGMRKYDLFENENLFFGMEYAKLFSGRYIHRIYVGPFYNRDGYEFSSYNGRHFGAHSGPDSDDFIIYFGWQQEKYTIIPSFNYERHGLQEPIIVLSTDQIQDSLLNPWPEVKFEFRIDFRYRYKEYDLNLYFEQELVKNLEFKNKDRTGTVIWVGIERLIDTDELGNKLRSLFKN